MPTRFLFLLASIFALTLSVFAQSTDPSPSVSPKASASAEGEIGEVDKLLKEGIVAYGTRKDVEGSAKSDPNGKSGAGDAIAGYIIKRPQPQYPARAKAVRAQGIVAVQVMVDEKGKVIAAQIESGHPLLKAAALEAARGLEFTPMLYKGKPVKIVGIVQYNFRLQ